MKASAVRSLKQVFISRVVVSTLIVLAGSTAVIHARGGGGAVAGMPAAALLRPAALQVVLPPPGSVMVTGLKRRQGLPTIGGILLTQVTGIIRSLPRQLLPEPLTIARIIMVAVVELILELPCSSSETYVDGVTYYACGTTYYVQSYSGGTIVYVPSSPPPGY